MSNAPYRLPTQYCDAQHPRIRELARELTRGCADEVQSATRVFEWVQDEIRYSIRHNWSQTASETVELSAGSCTNKANLCVALYRALGLAAGYHVMRVLGKYYFGPGWIPMVQKMTSEVSIHVHPAVHLNGRWIKCDPSDDLALTEGTAHINPPSERVGFDGHHDAILNIHPEHIIDTSGCLPSIDNIIGKITNKPPIYFRIMDLYLEFGRQWAKTITQVDELEPKFRQWVAEFHSDERAEIFKIIDN